MSSSVNSICGVFCSLLASIKAAPAILTLYLPCSWYVAISRSPKGGGGRRRRAGRHPLPRFRGSLLSALLHGRQEGLPGRFGGVATLDLFGQAQAVLGVVGGVAFGHHKPQLPA